jgi:hypothetical protein
MKIILPIYCLFQLYFFRDFRKAFPKHPSYSFMLITFLSGTLFLPIGLRIFFDKTGWLTATIVLAYICYCWMGFVIIYFFCSFSIKVLNFLLKTLSPWKDTFVNRKENLFYWSMAVSFLFSIYGYRESMTLHTAHLTLYDQKIRRDDQIRIVLISDIHAGLIVREKRIRNMLTVISAATPDLVVIAGDMIDGAYGLSGLSQLFVDLEAPRGKYAILGNHEYHAGLSHAINFIEDAGFELLLDRSSRLNDSISLIGVDDPGTGSRHPGYSVGKPEYQVLETASPDTFRILLKHRPVVNRNSNFDLQLSGHTHGGQMYPFKLIISLVYKVRSAWIRNNKGQLLCVSNGAGTWGPPFRIFAPPSVTIIDLFSHQE